MKEDKKLEEFIKSNKSHFDNELPKDGHQLRFEEKLHSIRKPHKIIRVNQWKYLAYAASVALLVMSMFTFYLYGHKEAMLASMENDMRSMESDMVLSLMENQSPSKRLKAVNYIDNHDDANSEIINAMINTLHHDENANVRLATAGGLARFSEKAIVKKALADALQYEKDPYVQIDLIQILVSIQEKSAIPIFKKLLDDETTPAFIKEQVKTKIIKL